MTQDVFRHRHLLVVEDEYLIAESLCFDLVRAGATVVGPAGSAADALTLLRTVSRIDAAVLDLNLGGEIGFAVADALQARGIPFVFTTGYDEDWLQARYPIIPRCEKPFELAALAASLKTALARAAARQLTAQRRVGPSGKPASRSPWA